MERTFALIKPDATERNLHGEIIDCILKAGFNIVGLKMFKMEEKHAKLLYGVHKDKDFFPNLISFICSAPVLALVLESENAVQKYRNLMGATNPEEATEGTLRKRFALSQSKNSVHGSDSVASANQEISYFFSAFDLV